jgi:hypothetical protein
MSKSASTGSLSALARVRAYMAQVVGTIAGGCLPARATTYGLRL